MSSISGANKTAVTTDYAPAGFGRHVLERMFGEGPQSDYRAAGERAIKSVALRALAYKKALLESSVASPVESPGAENPFLRLLTELSLRRHRHAVEAKSPQANHFGNSRVKHSVPFRDVMVVLADVAVADAGVVGVVVVGVVVVYCCCCCCCCWLLLLSLLFSFGLLFFAALVECGCCVIGSLLLLSLLVDVFEERNSVLILLP
jgi:hypothetical protein